MRFVTEGSTHLTYTDFTLTGTPKIVFSVYYNKR